MAKLVASLPSTPLGVFFFPSLGLFTDGLYTKVFTVTAPNYHVHSHSAQLARTTTINTTINTSIPE